MNHDVPPDDASIIYYDGDYPSLELDEPTAEDVASLARNGMLGDVPFYRELALRHGGPVLELGCGTGRLAIPIARAGVPVTGVDISRPMLRRFQSRLDDEAEAVRARVRLLEADATTLRLEPATFPLVAIPFNVLILMADRERQKRVLEVAARHMTPDGVLALDIMNPLVLSLGGDPSPQPSFPRRNPRTGNSYVKHAMTSRLDEDQKQRIHGWYEERLPSRSVLTTDYSFQWRLIFRWELTEMLERAGLVEDSSFGDFEGAPWTVDSTRIIVVARRGG